MSKLRFFALICGKHLKFGFSTTKFPTTMNGIPLILICALFFAKNGLAQQRVNMEDVRLIQQDSLQQVDVFVGRKLFTTYIYRTGSMKTGVVPDKFSGRANHHSRLPPGYPSGRTNRPPASLRPVVQSRCGERRRFLEQFRCDSGIEKEPVLR